VQQQQSMRAPYKTVPLTPDLLRPNTPIRLADGTFGVISQVLPKDKYHSADRFLAYRQVSEDWVAPSPYTDQRDNLNNVAVLTGRKGTSLLSSYLDTRRAKFDGNPGGAGFTIANDPEIFVIGGNGYPLPAWTFLPEKQKRNTGSASEPINKEYRQAFWDGHQAEFTTRCHSCLAYLADDIHWGMREILLAARVVDPHAHLTLDCVRDVNPSDLAEADEKHISLGCSPSRNVYDLPPINVENSRHLPFRFAGCHMHFGGKFSPDQISEIIRTLDAIVGICQTAFAYGFEDPRRRHFYGMPGEYRLPSHGVEWRTPSATSMLVHPAMFHFWWDLARNAARLALSGLRFIWQAEEKDVVRILLDTDGAAARKVVEANMGVLNKIVKYKYGTTTDYTPTLERVLLGGMREILTDPTDVERNWCVGVEETALAGWGTTPKDIRPGEWHAHSEGENQHFAKAAKTLQTPGAKL
jgi:hypothetical protein